MNVFNSFDETGIEQNPGWGCWDLVARASLALVLMLVYSGKRQVRDADHLSQAVPLLRSAALPWHSMFNSPNSQGEQPKRSPLLLICWHLVCLS